MATDIRSIASAIAARPARSAASTQAPQTAGIRPASHDPRAGDRERTVRARPEPLPLSELSREAFGPVQLPSRLDLVAALEAARDFAPLADRAVPGLGRLVAAVIDDESRKLTRSLDLAGQ